MFHQEITTYKTMLLLVAWLGTWSWIMMFHDFIVVAHLTEIAVVLKELGLSVSTRPKGIKIIYFWTLLWRLSSFRVFLTPDGICWMRPQPQCNRMKWMNAIFNSYNEMKQTRNKLTTNYLALLSTYIFFLWERGTDDAMK